MDSLLKSLWASHGTLIVAALVLLVTFLSPTPKSFQTARDDFASLELWHKVTQDAGDSQYFPSSLLDRVKAINRKEAFETPQYLQFVWGGATRCVQVGKAFAFNPLRQSHPTSSIAPDSVAELAREWDSMRYLYLLTPKRFDNAARALESKFVGYGEVYADNDKQHEVLLPSAPEVKPLCEGKLFANAKAALEPVSSEVVSRFESDTPSAQLNASDSTGFKLRVYRIDDAGSELLLVKETVTIDIPMVALIARVDAQTALLESRSSRHEPGAFATTFPELAKLMKGKESMEVAQFRSILDSARPDGIVPVATIPIPAEALSWGNAIVIGLQVLLLMLTQRSVERLKPSELDESSWFPLFPGVMSRIATVLTIGILPFLTVVVTLEGALELAALLKWIVILLAAATSLWLGIATLRNVKILSARLTSGTAQVGDVGDETG